MVNYKSLWYIISTIKENLVTAKNYGLWSVKPFILTLRKIICFWSNHYLIFPTSGNWVATKLNPLLLWQIYESDLWLWWPEKLCICGHATPVQTNTVLANSKIFLNYDVRWNCLLVHPHSLNIDFSNLQKVTWTLLLGRDVPD